MATPQGRRLGYQTPEEVSVNTHPCLLSFLGLREQQARAISFQVSDLLGETGRQAGQWREVLFDSEAWARTAEV